MTRADKIPAYSLSEIAKLKPCAGRLAFARSLKLGGKLTAKKAMAVAGADQDGASRMTRADVLALSNELYAEFDNSEFPKRRSLLLGAYYHALRLHTALGRIEFFDEKQAEKMRAENETAFVNLMQLIGGKAA